MEKKFVFVFTLGFSLVPLLLVSFLSYGYETPKLYYFVVLVQLTGLSLLLFIAKNKKAMHHVTLDTVTKLVFLFGVLTFFSDIIGLDPKISLLGSPSRHQGFLLTLSCIQLFTIIRLLPSTLFSYAKQTFLLFTPFLLAIISSIGLWQAYAYNVALDGSISTIQGRIVGTIGSPNAFGGYIVSLLPLSLAGLLTILKKKQLVTRFTAQSLLFIVALGGILVSQSRSALLGLVFLLIVHTYQRFPIKSIKNSIYFSICLLGVILCLFFWTLWNKPIVFRYSFFDNQTIIWQVAVDKIHERPLLGYGQENFELIFPKARHYLVDNTHNIFLESAIASGIPTFVLFFLIIIYSVKNSPRIFKLSIIVFLITAQFNPLSVSQIIFFWILLSLSKNEQEPKKVTARKRH